MDTRMRRLPRPAVAGGLAVLAGSVLWGLGIEFERIWEAAYERPEFGNEPSGGPGKHRPVGRFARAPGAGLGLDAAPALVRSDLTDPGFAP
jgi:hypothetical protein